MTAARHDPWADTTFRADREEEAAQRAERTRHREVVQIPRLRALGSLWLYLAVIAHNAIVLGGVDWPLVGGFGVVFGVYVAATTWVLRRHYRVDAAVDLGTTFLATDIALFVLAIYVSGGERSWLIPLLCVRVADQVGTSRRRALFFAHLTAALHALLIAHLWLIEQRALSPGGELVKLASIYLLNLYLAQAAGPSERQRERAVRMAENTRSLIEELGKRSQELETARVRAEAASEAKGRFLANMSHEIRTPMNGVLGAAELLRDGRLSDDQRTLVETIATAGESLLAIVNDVLDMSKIEEGQVRLDRVDFELTPLARDVMRALDAQATTKGVELIAEIEDPGVPLRGDPLRLRQVLTNLVGNALKFTDEGSVRLRVECLERSEQVVVLRFKVIDTGIGMTEAQCARIFDAFKQADDSTTRRFGGTGLGLAIARQLVEMMGDRLDVQSQLGKGTCFGFVLRVPPGDPEVVALHREGGPDVAAELSARAPRVLVAEDTEINRVLVTRMLESLGCRVRTVEDGAQAVEVLCAAHDYAIVLMDWHMPVLDGLEATVKVRAWERARGAPPVPVVAFTASAFDDEVERCREAGMDGVLSKPLTRANLIRVVARHVLERGSSPDVGRSAARPSEPAPINTSMIEQLRELESLEPGFLAEMVARYLSSAPARLDELAAALERADGEALRAAAHALRGSGGALGAERLGELLSELERMGREERLTGADRLLSDARGEYARVASALQDVLRDPPG
ncbi:MAG: ATP-binding protein [Myxococcales bacterium]|nr:ATP-binding protein [Myxococcales bacterium]